MKQILYSIMMCCLMVTFLTACSQENDPFPQGEGTKGNSITLKLSTGIQFQTRAEAAGAEVAVSHLDVFIFDANETMRHYERVSNCTNERGTVTLAASKDDFDANTGYYVYLLANSTHATDDFKNLANLSALKAMTQEDKLIHLTGLENVTGAPKTFLMDGIAYSASEALEPQTATPVVLNDNNPSTDTELKVMLRRAAAKIIIHVKKGADVTFDNGPSRGYYLRNMPCSTSLLAGVNAEAELTTPDLSTNTTYYTWTENEITLTAYTYAHEWADASAFEKEVRLVVNIPLKYNDTDYPISYYQIPVCKDKVLERNTCYEVTVTVSAPGGTDPSAPAELSDISYSVTPWNEKEVGIGGDDERPIYLYVNEEEMEMHNITDDNTTLEFASSSAVSATVTRVYYIDKFGQAQVLKKIPDTDNEYGIRTGGWWPTWNNRCTIEITPDEGINGKLDVYSTLPENNTIRYIDFDVTNADGITRKVTVAQYPLTYITNIEGYYSYRDDFVSTASDGTSGVTTWELLAGKQINKGSQYTNAQVPYNENDAWICGCSWNSDRKTWSYGKTTTGFFASKVVKTYNASTGLSDIEYARWTEYWSGTLSRPRYTYNTSTSSVDLNNHRMYHVVITASSGEYTLGVPRITDGKTDPGSDNAQLVSPSFMLASQLGAVMAIQDLEGAAVHCERYVEVAKDGTVYDDWRLPTQAEIMIIYKYQNDSDAMDEVLAGNRYWSASGLVAKPGVNSPSDRAIRCIRDAYKK